MVSLDIVVLSLDIVVLSLDIVVLALVTPVGPLPGIAVGPTPPMSQTDDSKVLHDFKYPCNPYHSNTEAL